MITSLSNAKIKHLKELQLKSRTRNKENLFVAEGFKMFLEAPEALIKEVYVESNTYEKIKESDNKAPLNHFKAFEKIEYLKKKGVFVESVSEEVFRKSSDTETPQGIIFVMDRLKYDLKDMTNGNMLLIEDIQDPGNLGTMIRTAEGASIAGVVMTKGTVDIYNPKTVRATMGSLYRVPFIYVENLKEAADFIKSKGVKIYAAHLKGEKFYDEVSYDTKSAFLIGNEGNGLSDEASSLADELIKIPMGGELESLNAAVAAAILMYSAR